MKARHTVITLALAPALALVGCGGDPAPSTSTLPPTSAPAPTPAGATPGSGTPATSASPAGPVNDLARGRLSRTFRAGKVTISAEYSTPLPVARWTAGVAKPLDVSMTAFVNGKRDQKLYVSRVTVFPNASDERGDLGAPDPLVDTANLSPGYIVTFPNTYEQRFVVPQVDATAKLLTIDVRYELLIYRGGNNPRDYAKQSATDTLTVPLTS